MNHPAGGDFALFAETYASFVGLDPDFAWLLNLEGWNTLFEQIDASILCTASTLDKNRRLGKISKHQICILTQ
ncbi:hypothetical protein HBI56_213180 [Parastagonospora nodorum]|nr:hypothetical protein HBH43_221700 [Parastagonospora nodorum]KAH4212126.1 hypothetical protein HBI95_049940 [Parastagonospora nodorum]KAH4337933.1 hypothetical protein HBH98_216140 [Parastagonospora nodorum]KAH4360547.1 hypothetical protein HBH97_205540 [Parastagonospora nodorum]KAH4376313.1 hypothetical protein HBH99_213670 [Parastagonospora nodorum]